MNFTDEESSMTDVIQFQRRDGTWVDAGEDFFPLTAEQARRQTLSLTLGSAVRQCHPGGGATVSACVDFGGDAMAAWIARGGAADVTGRVPEIEAFFDRRGALDRERLRKAAELLLETEARGK